MGKLRPRVNLFFFLSLHRFLPPSLIAANRCAAPGGNTKPFLPPPPWLARTAVALFKTPPAVAPAADDEFCEFLAAISSGVKPGIRMLYDRSEGKRGCREDRHSFQAGNAK